MSVMLRTIKELVVSGEVRDSDHGYDKFAIDGLRNNKAVWGGVEQAALAPPPQTPTHRQGVPRPRQNTATGPLAGFYSPGSG